MVWFPRKDPILFQLGLKAAELPCFESVIEHRSAEALEDNHRLLLQCGNWKFNFFLEITMHTPKAPTRPQDIHLPYVEEVHKYNYIGVRLHQLV
jgi:hypothetical protein